MPVAPTRSTSTQSTRAPTKRNAMCSGASHSSNKPIVVSIEYCESSEPYFDAIKTHENPVWLDSGKPLSHLGRFDIISASPSEFFRHERSADPQQFIQQLDQFQKNVAMRVSFDGYTLPELPFWGGLIGYLDYDFLNKKILRCAKKTTESKEHEHAESSIQNNISSEVGFYTWALIQDHTLKQSHLIFLPFCDARFIKDTVALIENTSRKLANKTNYFVGTWRRQQTLDAYTQSLNSIDAYIHAGDAYQINYSQQFSTSFIGNPADAYSRLRQTVPSHFSACLLFPSKNILCVSPERFITIKKSPTHEEEKKDIFIAITQPIKGTAARDENPSKDQALAQELLDSEKNQSENVMIVDLLRNDFGKNCITGSVKTTKLFELESYANVHHLVSTVEGKLNPSTSPMKFLEDCFPGGSITGAPKKRAMEIINELEPHNRDIYCGSIFYQSLHGNLDSNIAIRTMMHDTKRNTLSCYGGGGIIADSDVRSEYDESINKVKILMDALRK